MGFQVQVVPSNSKGFQDPPATQEYVAPPKPKPAGGSYDAGEERVSLGVFILDKIWNGTIGSLSIDLKRPRAPVDDRNMASLFTVRRTPLPPGGNTNSRPAARPRGRPPRPPPSYGYPQQQPTQYVDYQGDMPNYAFEDTGARIKAMRHIQMGPKFENVKYGKTLVQPVFDLGFGASFDLDTAEFHPQIRLKFRDALSLKIIPRPAVKFQKRMQLGTTGYGVRLTYECPLEELDRCWMPPARLMVSLDNTVDSGVRVTQSGLEFSANSWLLGDAMRLRASGTLSLPTELPVQEGDQWVQFKANRLGLKARW